MNVDRSPQVFLTGLLLCGVLAAFAPCGAKANSDVSTGSYLSEVGHMTDMRSGHTGTILLVGGDAGDLAAVSTAELFDPAANQFVSVGDMHDARISHCYPAARWESPDCRRSRRSRPSTGEL